MPSPPEDFRSEIQETLQEFINSEGTERQDAAERFASLLKKAKEQRESEDPADSDCPDDVVDCNEVVSPCCGDTLSNVFGTLPLQVACRKCNKRHYMGEIVRNSIKSEKK